MNQRRIGKSFLRAVGLACLVAGLLIPAVSDLVAAPPPVPSLASLVEPTAPAGASTATIRAIGLFTDGDQMTADGVDLPTIWVSQNEVTATLSQSQLAVPTTYQIRVVNGNGESHPQELHVSTPRVSAALAATPLNPRAVPVDVTFEDLNGDGLRDLIYLTDEGAASAIDVKLAVAGGGFAAPTTLRTSLAMTNVALADVDNDADVDLLAVQGNDARVTVFANNGSAAFSNIHTIATGHGTRRPLQVGDVNGDGLLDFVFANQVENTIGVHLGNGDGTFLSQPAFASTTSPRTPVLADVDGSGSLDVVAFSGTLFTLALHRGNGDGSFQPATAIAAPAGVGLELVAGDVNNDGRLDLLLPPSLHPFGQSPGFELRVLLGAADGSFALASNPPQSFPLSTSIALTDIDADGDRDIVVADGFVFVHIYRGNNTGSFTPWITNLQPGITPRAVVATDINDDGMPDPVIVGLDTQTFPATGSILALQQTEPPPLPQLVLPDATFTETDGFSTIVTMPVLLVDASGAPTTSTAPVTIAVRFTDGTARVGDDYQPSPATSFTIFAGASQGTIDFRVTGGTLFEPTESFTVEIASANGATIRDGTATVTIFDNDPPPPMADVFTTLTMDDTFDPGEVLTGTVTVGNNGPATVGPASFSIPLDPLNTGKLTDIQIPSSTFTVSGVNGGFVSGSTVQLATNQTSNLTFVATPTGFGPEDLYYSANDSTSLLPLNYSFNQASSAGRTGVAFEQDGNGQVNDLILYDPDPNFLRIVRNADSVTTATQVIDLEAILASYRVTSIQVCRLRDGSTLSAVMSLIREPGGTGDESIVAARELPADGTDRPIINLIERPVGSISDLKCTDLDNDGDDDVAVLWPETHELVVGINNGAGHLALQPPIATAPLTATQNVAAGDFDNDGDNDLAVLGQNGAASGLLMMLGDGSGALTPRTLLINLGDLLGASGMIGGLGFDSVANARRPIDFNQDGYPDLMLACTRCAPGETYGVVPIRNLGTVSPADFETQTPIAIGVPGRPHGTISMLGTPLVNETFISLAAKDGFNTLLENTTPAGAQLITLQLRPEIAATNRLLGGAGPSAIVALNAYNDNQPDFLALDVGGRIVVDVNGSGTGAGDPDLTNNGEVRTVGTLPGPPNQFRLQLGLRWEPNTIGRLENVASDPVVNSLNGARVFVQDQNGNTADAQVLSTSNTEAMFLWPLIADVFRLPGAQITLYAETAGGRGASSTAPVIEESDLPTINIDDPSVAEGNSGTTNITFTVTLSAPSTQTVTASYITVAEGTARPFEDYDGTSGTLVFEPGETSKEVVVQVFGDLQFEPDETFSVRLESVVNAALRLGDTGVGTILNDDLPTVSINNSVSVLEGNTGQTDAVFTVTLSAPITQPVTVNYTTEDFDATGGEDYVPITSGQLTFNPGGPLSQEIRVAVNGDPTVESDETFLVTLTGATGAEIPTLGGHFGVATILNDDLPTLSISDVSVTEGNTNERPDAVFTVTLSAPSNQLVTVNFDTEDGSARGISPGASDFVPTAGTLIFNPGETTKEIRVAVLGETLFEADENFFADLTGADGATIADGRGEAIIVNDDPQPTVSIAARVSLPEGDSGTTDVVFTVTLSAPSTQPVSVSYTTEDFDTIAGEDYVPITSGTLTFNPGEPRKEIRVAVNGDTIVESDETFLVTLTGATGADIPSLSNFGVATIINDDEPPPTVSLSDVRVVEGTGPLGTTFARFTVSLSRPSDQPVRITYATAAGTATPPGDYAEQTGSTTIPAGATSAEIFVSVEADALDEPDETFFVNLTGATGATIADGQGEGTIVDDDEPPPTVSLSDVRVVEGTGPLGTTFARFTVSLSRLSDQPVRITYATAAGTATSNEDYTEQTGSTTIPAGATSADIFVSVDADALDEPDETFFVNLTGATGATIADGQGEGTIVDDDSPSDTVPPTITTSPTIKVPAASAEGTIVYYPAPVASDNSGRPPAVFCEPPSGALFPIGKTTVVCTATDAAGNRAQSTFQVNVQVGKPHIATQVVRHGETAPGSGLLYFDVELTNTGTGHARDVEVDDVALRAPARGTATLDTQTALPISVGDLDMGGTAVVRVFANVSDAVKRLSLRVTGVFATVVGELRNYKGAPDNVDLAR